LVDAESVSLRLQRLDSLLRVLDEARERGEDALVSDVHLQLEVERALQVAIQICIDVGAHLVSGLGQPPPGDYRGVFAALGVAGVVEADLAKRLGDAARLRNLLVHDYGEIDHRLLWRSLGQLDDLRAFAAAAQLASAPPG
jgi:uncharacterized protein YutE (UPF0331/DUF86 family)